MILDKLRREQSVPVVLANDMGIVTYINDAFCEAFAWEPDQLVGRPLTVLIPAGMHDAHSAGFSRFLVTARPRLLNRRLELPIFTGDGREVDAEHFIQAEKEGGRWVFGARVVLR